MTINSLKKYYAYNRACMEKIDSCEAYSRLDAAKIFSSKKQITLKAWLNIYITYPFENMDKMYGKNVYFRKNGITYLQYKVLKNNMHVVQRFNDSDLYSKSVMTRNNFIRFMSLMKDHDYVIDIEQYPNPVLKY